MLSTLITRRSALIVKMLNCKHKVYFYLNFSFLINTIRYFPLIILEVRFLSSMFIEYCLFYYSDTYIKQFFLFLSFSSLFRLKTCLDLTLIDQLNCSNRFCVIYVLFAYTLNKRVLFLSFVSCNNSLISISSIYKSLNWSEREVFDMFGLFVQHNNSLRRILVDYGFLGYPLLKSFPCNGFIELALNSLNFLEYREHLEN